MYYFEDDNTYWNGNRATYSLQTTIEIANTTAPQYFIDTKWTDLDNSTPMQDLRDIQKIFTTPKLHFGSRALLFLNSTTAQYLVCNKNNKDLYGRFAGGLSYYKTLEDVNKKFKDAGLPHIVIYDGNWSEAKNAYEKPISDGQVIIVAHTDDTKSAYHTNGVIAMEVFSRNWVKQ